MYSFFGKSHCGGDGGCCWWWIGGGIDGVMLSVLVLVGADMTIYDGIQTDKYRVFSGHPINLVQHILHTHIAYIHVPDRKSVA